MLRKIIITMAILLLRVVSLLMGLSGAIGAGWLILIGEWKTLVFGGIIFALLSIPLTWAMNAIQVADIAILSDESPTITRKQSIALMGSSVALAFCISIWQTSVVVWFGNHMTNTNWIPIFLIAYGICLVPCSNSRPNNPRDLNTGMAFLIISNFIGAILSILTYLFLTIDIAGVVFASFLPVLIGRALTIYSIYTSLNSEEKVNID